MKLGKTRRGIQKRLVDCGVICSPTFLGFLRPCFMVIPRPSFQSLLLAGLAALLCHAATQAQATERPAKPHPGVTPVCLVYQLEEDFASNPADQTLSATG